MKFRNITFSLFILLFGLTLHAQDPLDPGWLWAERGGSSAVLSGFQLHDWGMERIIDIAIDGDNNYYYLAEVGGYNFTLGEMEFDTHNDYASHRDIFVFSTDNNGNFRWSKVIGGRQNDVAISLGTDSFGNVYVSGIVWNASGSIPVHFDTDTIMPQAVFGEIGPQNKKAFLIKYNSEGDFQWLRMPEDDNAPYSYNAWMLKTVVDPNGTTHSLMKFKEGSHLNGQLNIPEGDLQGAIVKYNIDGDMEGFFKLDMSPLNGVYNYQLAYDTNLDRYYVADTYRGTTGIMGIDEYGDETNAFYLAAVNNQGEVLWYHQDDFREFYTTGDLKLDEEGNIYFTGKFVTPSSSASNPNSFAGYEFEAEGTGSGIKNPFLIKLDSDGNLLWGTNAQLYSPFNGQSIVVNGANVYLGLGMLNNTWDNLDVLGPTGQGLVPDIQIIRFDAQTGEAQEVIHNNAITHSQDAIMAMAIDHNGALVVGGYFGSSLFYGTDLYIHNNGQGSDFFIAKYQTEDTIDVGGIENRNLTTLKVYPNPTTGMLYLKSEIGLQSYALYDLQGRIVKQGSIETSQIDMSGMESGVYIIRVEDLNNTVQNLKVVKEL